MPEDKDLIIIGSGPGGYVAAIRAAQLGLNVKVIEKEKVLGGTCLHWGCIPTKALLHQANLYYEISRSSVCEIGASKPGLNIENLMKYKKDVVDRMEKGINNSFKKYGIELITGEGSLTEGGDVLCRYPDGGEDVFKPANVILATGSEAMSLPGVEFDGEYILSNKEILNFDKIPESLIVIGAGAVGVEFATMMRFFGCEVNILEMLPDIVPLEDKEISRELQRAFKKKKIKVLTEARVAEVNKKDGKAIVSYTRKDKESEIEAEKVLIATGRRANIDGIGLETAGVKTEGGFVSVDKHLRTSVKNIFAIGDIIDTPQLAHSASAEGIYVVEKIAEKNPEPINFDLIPSATYCEPQVASVGLTESEAVERGYEVKTGKCRFNTLARAHILEAPEGFVRVVADEKTDKLLGLHIIGPDATEMIAEGITALHMGATVKDLLRSIHPHPTLSEVIGEALEDVDGESIHG